MYGPSNKAMAITSYAASVKCMPSQLTYSEGLSHSDEYPYFLCVFNASLSFTKQICRVFVNPALFEVSH